MQLRDRAVIGLLSLILVGLTGAVVAPSLAPGGPGPTPGSSLPVLRTYVEGIVGSAVSVSPFSAQSVAERQVVALLFKGLVRLGPDDQLIGDLAERWDVDADGRAWTFHLRPGLLWQDGQPLTAEDVLFTVGALSDPSYVGPGAASWREVTATASDPLTVTLTLATPLGGFLEAAIQPIAPAHLLAGTEPADLPNDEFGRHPVGSGSFRLAVFDDTRALLLPHVAEPVQTGNDAPLASAPAPTDSLATAAPSARAGGPLPYLNGIEFRFFKDTEALLSAWRLGQLDGAAGLSAAEASELAAGGGARVLRYPSTTLFEVLLNLRPSHPEFQDAAVRKALLQAIDRDEIVRDLLGGLATRADSLIPPTSWAFDPLTSVPVAFDQEAAKAALLAAGWKLDDAGAWIIKGANAAFDMEILSPQAIANPTAFAIADAVAAAWRAIGLRVSHIALPGAEFVGERLQAGDYDAAVTGTTIGLDPDLYPILASTQATSSGSNFSGLQDPALDPLLVKARAPGTEEERAAAYVELQARLAESSYILPVAFRDLIVVVRDTLTGPRLRPVGGPGDRFWDVLTWRLADGR